jgi:hypothetical protein
MKSLASKKTEERSKGRSLAMPDICHHLPRTVSFVVISVWTSNFQTKFSILRGPECFSPCWNCWILSPKKYGEVKMNVRQKLLTEKIPFSQIVQSRTT